jgi:hypothetical protein
MKPSRITTLFLISIILLLTGCQLVKFNLPVFAPSPSPTVMPSATAVPPTATVQALPTPTVAPTAAPKAPVYAPVIDPANFVIGVNNPYFPLKPGRSMTYTGKKGKVSLREQVAVTKNTRVVMGVTCMEVVDTLWESGKLAQKTLRWYAQDKDGTVWYFGAEAKQYKKGKVSGMDGSWQAGAGGAQPGIIMLAHPTRGDTYRQDYLEGVVEDMAYVVSLDGALKVPYHAYKNLLITLNWSNLTPTVIEDHYYAKGVGFVYSEIVQGGKGEMKLVKIKK